MPTLMQSRILSVWGYLILRNTKSNPFVYVYVNSSLNTSDAGTFRRTSLPLNPSTNDFGILKTCLPVIKKSESLSIAIIFPLSSLSLERTPFSTSLSQFWIISGKDSSSSTGHIFSVIISYSTTLYFNSLISYNIEKGVVYLRYHDMLN